MDRFRKLFARFSRKNSHPENSTSTGLVCQEVVELVTEYLEDALLPENVLSLKNILHTAMGVQIISNRYV